MRFVATLYAHDVMDQVFVHLCVRRYPGISGEESNIAFECTTTIPGIGESAPDRWAEDALLGMLEAL